MARTSGWCAHIFEQRSKNKLVRPKSLYIGPEPRKFVPIAKRKLQPKLWLLRDKTYILSFRPSYQHLHHKELSPHFLNRVGAVSARHHETLVRFDLEFFFFVLRFKLNCSHQGLLLNRSHKQQYGGLHAIVFIPSPWVLLLFNEVSFAWEIRRNEPISHLQKQGMVPLVEFEGNHDHLLTYFEQMSKIRVIFHCFQREIENTIRTSMRVLMVWCNRFWHPIELPFQF